MISTWTITDSSTPSRLGRALPTMSSSSYRSSKSKCINDLRAKAGLPNKQAVTSGNGKYYRLGGNFIKISTGVPLTLESAKMYIGHNGKITFTLATFGGWSGTSGSYSYVPLYSTSIDVYATRTVATSTSGAAADPADAGGTFNLNIPIPVPGNYIIIIDCLDSTTTFANIVPSGGATIAYPVSLPGVFAVTGNDQGGNSADSTTSQKQLYYPFYSIGIRLAGCPGTSRTPVTATTTTAPVITQNGNVFTSSFDDGNQWYRTGTLLVDSTAKTCTAIYSGTYQTIVVQPIIKSKGIFSENSKAEIWFSEDANRIMVQLKADLPVGSLNLYLTSARPPTLSIPTPVSPP